MIRSSFASGLKTVVLLVLLTVSGSSRGRAAGPGLSFPTPEAAVSALAEAARSADRAALRRLFGLDAEVLVAADQVQATNELAEFSAAFTERHRLVEETGTQFVLEVGTNSWPFPIPIARRSDGSWFFDTAAGQDELLNRRIGRNELAVLEVLHAVVDAQREYASRDRDGDGVLEFAARLDSSPGLQDGLYWPPELNGETSPLGPLVAQAQSEGYRRNPKEGGPQPFHGYYFRPLNRQGRHAPGGSHRYVVNGNQIGGFALVAWPAQYGESGVMTFLVNQQGRIHQKDLGPRTARAAAGLTRYDPDDTWHPADEPWSRGW